MNDCFECLELEAETAKLREEIEQLQVKLKREQPIDWEASFKRQSEISSEAWADNARLRAVVELGRQLAEVHIEDGDDLGVLARQYLAESADVLDKK